MTAPYRPTLRRAVAARSEILDILARLDPEVLRRFWELGQVSAQPDGFPPGGGSGRRSGEVSRPTQTAALAPPVFDPVGAWLDELYCLLLGNLRHCAIRIDDLRAKILEIKPAGRENQIEVCVMCNEPNPRMHRIDGQPYCATSCYHRENRRRRYGALPEDAA